MSTASSASSRLTLNEMWVKFIDKSGRCPYSVSFYPTALSLSQALWDKEFESLLSSDKG